MNYRNFSLVSTGIFALLVPVAVFGQSNSTWLVGIPGITDPGLNFGDYINALYALSISVAALVAVIKIIIAGMKYMLSDVVTNKSEAISDIQGSVFGLIIVISAVLILTEINPNLTETTIFIDPVVSTPNSPSEVSSGTVITEKGYQYAKAGTVASFKTDCTALNGIYRLEAGNDVCYSPLPEATINDLDTTYNVAVNPEDGSLYYPTADRKTVHSRYQTSHYPRLITNTNTIKEEKRATEVLIGVSLTAANDWIDKANRSELVTTCVELQRATNKPTLYVSGGDVSANTGYIACIVD